MNKKKGSPLKKSPTFQKIDHVNMNSCSRVHVNALNALGKAKHYKIQCDVCMFETFFLETYNIVEVVLPVRSDTAWE